MSHRGLRAIADRMVGKRRFRRFGRLAATAVTAAVAVTMAACGSSPEGALQGKSATKIVSLSITALHHERSFHFVTKTVEGSQTQVEVGDVGRSAAAETVQSGSSPILDAELVDKAIYLRAGTQVLENSLGLSATVASVHSGAWLEITSGDADYSTVADSLTATSAIELFVPEEPHLRVAGATHFSGHATVAVEGSSPYASAGDLSVVTLFVSTTAPFLPVGATLVVTNTNGKVLEQVASLYGKWNTKVDPRAPQEATPLSSLAGS